MKTMKLLVLTLIGLGLSESRTEAFNGRQYYDTSWTYNYSQGYYYNTYYYQTSTTTTTYSYNYCIYYPQQPSYIYYYNPAAQVYWGRYEVGSKGDKRYSLLAPKDKKKDLKDISPSAFPAAAKMPKIPDSEDGVTIEPPPEGNLPKDKPSSDLPKSKDKPSSELPR